jgi:integrase
VQRGFLGDNPVRRTQLPRAVESERAGWTAEEARRFLAAASDHLLASAFHLAAVAGLRRGEVLGLRWSDLDLDVGRLRVAQQLMVEAGRIRLKPVPDRHRRTVALPPHILKMLVNHRRREADHSAGASMAAPVEDLVFCAPGGGWLTPERLAQVMEDLIEQSHVPRITPNGLRQIAHLSEPSPGETGMPL